MSDHRFGPFWIHVSRNEARTSNDNTHGPYTYSYSIKCDWFAYGEPSECHGRFFSPDLALQAAKAELREVINETTEDLDK